MGTRFSCTSPPTLSAAHFSEQDMSGQNLRPAHLAIHSDQIESFARNARDDFFASAVGPKVPIRDHTRHLPLAFA
jgi:hypothetical protein